MTAERPSQAPRGRPRSESSRQAILEATRDQLAAHGYERLSIQHVAEAAGVGKQTVYRWWPTKAALVAECVLAGYLLDERIVPADTGDVRRDVRAWFRAFTRHFARPEHAALLRALTVAAAESDEVAAKLLARLAEPFRAMLVARLSAGRSARRGVPVVLLVDALLGALVLRVLSREPIEPEPMARLVDALLAGVDARPARRGAVTPARTRAARARKRAAPTASPRAR